MTGLVNWPTWPRGMSSEAVLNGVVRGVWVWKSNVEAEGYEI
jgi:hypothetical protein